MRSVPVWSISLDSLQVVVCHLFVSSCVCWPWQGKYLFSWNAIMHVRQVQESWHLLQVSIWLVWFVSQPPVLWREWAFITDVSYLIWASEEWVDWGIMVPDLTHDYLWMTFQPALWLTVLSLKRPSLWQWQYQWTMIIPSPTKLRGVYWFHFVCTSVRL